MNGHTVGLGSLTGSGSVINASRTKGTLVIGFDGTDSTLVLSSRTLAL